MNRTPVLAAIALAAGCVLAPGHARAADATIESLLQQSNTPFEVDKDGDYKIVIEWNKEKRSQLVYVGGTPETFAGMPVYDVFSPALEAGENGLDAEDANALLKASGGLKLGAWELRGDGAYYAVKVPAGKLTAEQFDKILSLAAETADNFELEHSKSDDL
ncbi:MAG: hypothetical protein QM719_00655 [Thermomonas sp.]